VAGSSESRVILRRIVDGRFTIDRQSRSGAWIRGMQLWSVEQLDDLQRLVRDTVLRERNCSDCGKAYRGMAARAQRLDRPNYCEDCRVIQRRKTARKSWHRNKATYRPGSKA
jgi:hypothetical protein